MRPTFSVLGASRRPLTGKKANKDYYKGTGAARLPGGHRTGAPGVHVIRGKAKYRLIDEKVRVFVAPNIEKINNSPLKAYVHKRVEPAPYGSGPFGIATPGGLSGETYLRLFREAQRTRAAEAVSSPTPTSSTAQ